MTCVHGNLTQLYSDVGTKLYILDHVDLFLNIIFSCAQDVVKMTIAHQIEFIILDWHSGL